MMSCSIAYVMTNHSTSDDDPIIRLYVPPTTDQLGNSIHGGIYFELLKPHRHLSLKMNLVCRLPWQWQVLVLSRNLLLPLILV